VCRKIVRNPVVSPKLAKKYYFCPYKILEFTGPVTALIETTIKWKPHCERFHVEKLKKYFSRDKTLVEVELPYSEGVEDAGKKILSGIHAEQIYLHYCAEPGRVRETCGGLKSLRMRKK